MIVTYFLEHSLNAPWVIIVMRVSKKAGSTHVTKDTGKKNRIVRVYSLYEWVRRLV